MEREKMKKVVIEIKRDKSGHADAKVKIDGQFYAGAYGRDFDVVLRTATGYASLIAPEWESGEPW